MLAKSHPFSSHPEKSGVIRVDSFEQSCIMQSDGKVGSKGKFYFQLHVHKQVLSDFYPSAFMHYYDNPKGMIPTWLINWAAKVMYSHRYIQETPRARLFYGHVCNY